MAVTEVTDSAAARGDHLCAEGVEIVYPGSRRDATTTLAVDGVSLAVRRGEFVVIVGPSGCGKTTLLNAVAGFTPINGGRLTLDDAPITGPSPERAMVFQQPSLLPWRSVLGNIAYGLDLARERPAAERRARATELLHLVGLGEFGARYPGQLSGGQQQRVNLARALAVRPSLLLLDEPFASIDAQTREQMQAELLRICAEEEVTALFVTHDITEAAFLADRVIVFGPRPGRIVREVTVPFPRPREGALRRDPGFAEVVEEIATALYASQVPPRTPTAGTASEVPPQPAATHETASNVRPQSAPTAERTSDVSPQLTPTVETTSDVPPSRATLAAETTSEVPR